MIDNRKVELFFALIRSVYGASKFLNTWPSDLDLQSAKIMWSEDINSHSADELRDALRNAQRQSANGNDDWQWPNIGLILSGTKRYCTAAHRPFLPDPHHDLPSANERAEIMQKIRNEVGL